VKTILQIIEEAGGLPKAECTSIDNEPWMRLVIEVLPERGPDGHVVVSVAHYGEQNSDPMRDPEILFEVEAGNLLCLPRRTRDLEQFAERWDRNLRAQGFLEAFRRRKCGQTESFENSGERR
jgi:hypothetical protein